LAQGKGKGKGKSGAGGTSSGGTSSGGSSGGSSSGGSSGGSGSSSGGSGGASSGGGSSSGSGGGGTGGTKSGQSGAHAHKTAGSSSTTTQPNNQSTVSVSTPNYAAALGFSTNNLTQGAGSASIVSASNVQQSQQTTGQANPLTMGVKPAAITPNVGYGQTQYTMMVEKYGKETADKLATQTYVSYDLSPKMAQNTDNQYLQNENAAITNAEKRQQEFVNNNTFASNPQPRATAPIPNVITVSTPLYRQAGEKENPLTILEGNKFISPAQQFLPQENEQFAPRPEYGAFTNNPYIGVHENSTIAPNADLSESQTLTWMDQLVAIKNHKYFPLAIVGIVVLVALSMFGGVKAGRAARSGGGKGVFRSTGGSGQPIITVVK